MKKSVLTTILSLYSIVILCSISCNKKDQTNGINFQNASKEILLNYLNQQKIIELKSSLFIDTLISKSEWSKISERSISKDVKLIYVPLNYNRNRIGMTFLYNNNTQSIYYSLITEMPNSQSCISQTKNSAFNKPTNEIIHNDIIAPIDIIAGFYKYKMNGYTGSIKAFSLSNNFLWEYGYQNGSRKYEKLITSSNIVNQSNKTSPKQSYSIGSNLVKSSGCTLYYLVTYYDDGSIDREFIGSQCDYGNDCQTTIGISEGLDIIKVNCVGGGSGGGSGNEDIAKIINDITDPCLKALISNLQNANKLTNAIGGILQNVFGENNNITLTFKQDDNLTDKNGIPIKGSASADPDNKNFIINLNNSKLKEYSPEAQTLTIMHEILHNNFKILYNKQSTPNEHTRMLNDYIEKLASSLEDLYPQLKSHHDVTIALCFANLRASVGDDIKDIKKSDFDNALNYYAQIGLFDLNDTNDWYRKANQVQWADKTESPLGSISPCLYNINIE